uniref:Rab-GAP TBC domain-containing protein n=1 Tax=Ciona savignyi TaxID=51511 RepID=H2ZIC1_CIOSA
MDQVWLELLETDQRAKYKMDTSVLHVAVRKGVSRHLRGRVWSVLHEQWKLRNENLRRASLGSVMLERSQFTDLLKQLTPHQHAILIDLGTYLPHPPILQPAPRERTIGIVQPSESLLIGG